MTPGDSVVNAAAALWFDTRGLHVVPVLRQRLRGKVLGTPLDQRRLNLYTAARAPHRLITSALRRRNRWR